MTVAGGVLERSVRRARGNIARVGGGEAQSAGAVDVDALTTGNDDVLIILVRGLGFAWKFSLLDRLLTRACLAWMIVSLVPWAQLGTTSGQ